MIFKHKHLTKLIVMNMRFIRLIVIVFNYITQKICGMKKSQIMQALRSRALSSAWPLQKILLKALDFNSLLCFQKIIPKNLEQLLIDPIALAIWYLDDGTKRNYNGHPNGSHVTMVVVLRLSLFLWKITINFKNELWFICLWYPFKEYVPSKDQSYLTFKNLIYSFVKTEIPSMLYKLEWPCNDWGNLFINLYNQISFLLVLYVVNRKYEMLLLFCFI